MPYFTEAYLQRIKDDGFDESTLAKCPQCDSRVINGCPTHEHGCPNWAEAIQNRVEGHK
jgi:hypothetical protein